MSEINKAFPVHLDQELKNNHINENEYINMLNESVKRRKLVLSRLQSDSASSQSSVLIEKEQSFSLNLESVILLENKLQRIAENTKLMRMPAEGKPREAFDAYEQ